jgi:peptidoglycan hydrolase-like protein with peptidoglycan-binding domain
MQVAFLLKEMKGFTSVWNTCCSSDSPYRCGYDICVYYEIPANKYAQGEYRGNLAKNWYDWLNAHEADHSSIPDDKDPEPDPEPQEDHSLHLRTIDKNCSGWDETFMLQDLLRLRHYDVSVDGYWTYLEEPVKQFQRDFSLTPDGIVGPKTWAALLKLQ